MKNKFALRPLAAAMAVAALALPATASAQSPYTYSPSNWMIGARVLDIVPNDSSSISGLSVDNQWTGELDFTYFFTPNVAVEVIAAWAKHQVNLNGTSIGKLGLLPPTVTLQYHFTNLGAWKPYVGGGFNYTYFYNDSLQIPTGFASPNSPAVNLHVNNSSWGGALQAGLDYQIQRNWYLNFDVKYLWINTDVILNATGNKLGSVDINPWVFGAGVRYRF
jgi:outer membrane protein